MRLTNQLQQRGNSPQNPAIIRNLTSYIIRIIKSFMAEPYHSPIISLSKSTNHNYPHSTNHSRCPIPSIPTLSGAPVLAFMPSIPPWVDPRRWPCESSPEGLPRSVVQGPGGICGYFKGSTVMYSVGTCSNYKHSSTSSTSSTSM